MMIWIVLRWKYRIQANANHSQFIQMIDAVGESTQIALSIAVRIDETGRKNFVEYTALIPGGPVEERIESINGFNSERHCNTYFGLHVRGNA